jgi:hypothetical protein
MCVVLGSQCEDGVHNQDCVVGSRHDCGAMVQAREWIVRTQYDLTTPVGSGWKEKKVLRRLEVVGISVVPLT